MPATRSTPTHVFAVVSALGLLSLVIGSFLPWFRSGSASRTSYEAASMAEQFGLFDNVLVTAALRGSVAFPLVASCCVGLYLLRFRRLSAVLGAALSAVAGTVGMIVAVQAGSTGGFVQATATGPLVTTTGAILGLVGAIGILITAVSTARPPAGKAGVYS